MAGQARGCSRWLGCAGGAILDEAPTAPRPGGSLGEKGCDAEREHHGDNRDERHERVVQHRRGMVEVGEAVWMDDVYEDSARVGRNANKHTVRRCSRGEIGSVMQPRKAPFEAVSIRDLDRSQEARVRRHGARASAVGSVVVRALGRTGDGAERNADFRTAERSPSRRPAERRNVCSPPARARSSASASIACGAGEGGSASPRWRRRLGREARRAGPPRPRVTTARAAPVLTCRLRHAEEERRAPRLRARELHASSMMMIPRRPCRRIDNVPPDRCPGQRLRWPSACRADRER